MRARLIRDAGGGRRLISIDLDRVARRRGRVSSMTEQMQTAQTNKSSDLDALETLRVKRRSILLSSITLAIVVALAFWSDWPGGEGSGAHVANAAGDEIEVATSVCSAHSLRERQLDEPDLQIEIPAEFDKRWPSASACKSAVAAWDPESPGPIQPIPFSHKHHAGEFKIDCLYCHSGTDESQAAGVPSVEVCMGCHSQFPTEYDEIEGIRILKDHWKQRKPIEWVQIHRLPEYVQFRHNRHVKAGVSCQKCHGPVEEIDKLHLVPDTHLGYLVPVAKLEMGWCIDCHRQNHQQASQDCLTCHY